MRLADSRSAAPISPPRELCVTQVSTTDTIGGAARAMQRLHGGLRAAGVRSRLLVAQRFGPDDSVREYNVFSPAPSALGQAFFRLTRRWHRPSVEKAGAYLSPDWTFAGWRLLSQMPDCDVVNLHWVTDFVDFRTLPALAQRYPLVWTLHDMNAFTGGCHYTGACEHYHEACGSCPQLATSAGEFDLTRRVMLRKQRVIQQIRPTRLSIVTPSHWLAKKAGESSLFRNFPIHVIPNGIDATEFRPMDRVAARQNLGLPASAKIGLFVSDSINESRKGFKLLVEAFASVQNIPNLLLITLGRGNGTALAGLPSRHLGMLSNPEVLRAAYAAADLFVIPSLQDNFPNTILEAMACGTPAVGFSTGGIGEAIEQGKTGLLAPAGDAAALGRAIRTILENPQLQETLSIAARRKVENEYTTQLQAARYAELYRSLLRNEMIGEPCVVPR